jgi:hypothetical protein
MFATKVIKAWRYSGDVYRLFIATYYFQESAKWKQITISDLTIKTHDPMYIVHAIK